jgi:methyl-accepting chemotaxis protein
MFKNLRISLRLGLSFSLILVIMIVIIFVSLNQIKVSRTTFDRIVKVNYVRLQLANNMIERTREVSINLRNILLLKESEKTLELKNRIDSIRILYDKDFKDLEGLILADDTASFVIVARIKASQDASRQLNNEVIDLALANKYDAAILLMNQKASKSVQTWINEIDDLITHNKDRTSMRYSEAERTQTSARSDMLILGAVAIVLAVIISILLTLSITRPLNLCVQTADRIASKDLTPDLNVYKKRNDEFGILLQSLSKMILILREQIHEILEGVNVLASSSSEILASTTQIASSSSETAAAISETSTTVEEVRQAAQLSSQKAKILSDSAQHVAQVSQGGQKSVEDTISGMSHIRDQMVTIEQAVVRLSEQSHSIGSIIASVTDIADQSNLLAVNAAIEAARSGEQGKGFSVVAQEIRNLAEQSKESTMHVRNILNDVQKATNEAVLATEQGNKAMETGVKQSLEAGEAIRILTGSISETAQVSTQIVASSQQQLVGMDQIGIAMQSINQAGIETAASMIQSEKSVRNLNDLGQKLKEIVERFKV